MKRIGIERIPHKKYYIWWMRFLIGIYIVYMYRCIFFSLFTLVFNLKSNLLKQLNCFASSEMRHFFFRNKFHWFRLKKKSTKVFCCTCIFTHKHIPMFLHVCPMGVKSSIASKICWNRKTAKCYVRDPICIKFKIQFIYYTYYFTIPCINISAETEKHTILNNRKFECIIRVGSMP